MHSFYQICAMHQFIMFNPIFVLADQIENLARHMSFQEWKTFAALVEGRVGYHHLISTVSS